jgi:cysteinyl-tRNA synthetase
VTLTLYNTLTRKKERFEPIDPANVRMYVCGPTVYDYAHIGNARPVIVFDVLFRLLRHLAKQGVWDGGKGETRVTYARNITDVDDKINARAAEKYPNEPLNDAIRKLTEETGKQFHDDICALGVLMPEDVNVPGERPVFVEPRATEHIAEMRALIEVLVDNKHAYVAQDHVLFDVSSMPDYGRLANRSLEEMEAGARVEVAPYKKGPMDFVLWKPSKPGEPAWPSPAGITTPGRPGWHIECSAMADKWLWQEPQLKGLLSDAGLKQPHVFDIHGGGIDLVFPHHENEIAQSRCAFHTPIMAKVWMHNGFLQVEGEKMSKSLGNFVTIRELLKEWPGEVVRFAMLSTHYRQPINWTDQRLRECKEEIWRWAVSLVQSEAESEGYLRAVRHEAPLPSDSVVAALRDDLNSPEAISVMRRHYDEAKHGDAKAKALLLRDAEFLGLLRHNRLWVHVSGAIAENAPGLAAKHYDDVQRLKLFVANGFDEERHALVERLRKDGVDANVSKDGHVTLRALAHADDRVANLIAARSAARKAKNFKEADRIRDELSAMGIQLKDSKDPATGEIVTTWEVKR